LTLNWDKIKKATEIIVLISGGIFGFWRFVYEDFLLPRSYPANLTIEATIEKAGELDSMQFVKMQIKIANHSKSLINILNSTYQVSGIIYEPGDLRKENEYNFNLEYNDEKYDTTTIEIKEGVENDGFLDAEHTSTRMGIYCGTLFSNNYLKPGNEDDRSYLIPVSKRFMTVYLRYQIYFTKKDISNLKQLELVNDNCEYSWLTKSDENAQPFNLSRAVDENNQIIGEYDLKLEIREAELLIMDTSPSKKILK